MVELARARRVAKPWGMGDLQPWCRGGAGERIGEVQFDIGDREVPVPALQLKLLFADAPLSVELRPDGASGRAGDRSRAWCVLRAAPGAKLAMTSSRLPSGAALAAAIDDGSIDAMADWRPISAGDVLTLPAGTVHALGAGLVVAEIRRLDEGSLRGGVDGGDPPPDAAPGVASAHRLGDVRSVLVAGDPFVIERLDFAPGERRRVAAAREAWLLVIEGGADIGLLQGSVGDAFQLNSERAVIEAGAGGATLLCAYPGPRPDPGLLQELPATSEVDARPARSLATAAGA